MSGMDKVLKKFLTKEHVKCALAAAIDEILNAGGGGGIVKTNAEIQGYIPSGNPEDGVTHTIVIGGIFGQLSGVNQYDADQFGAIPNIGPVVNPACGGQIGALVINPNLPEGSDGTFDLSLIALDNSGGLGSIFIFCPATGEIANSQPYGGSFGNNTGPQAATFSFDATLLNCPLGDVRVGITAWGVATANNNENNCDELSTVIGTLTTVTPSKLGAVRECFANIFCGFGADQVAGVDGNDGASAEDLEALTAKVNSMTVPRSVYKLANPIRGFSWETWGPREGREVGDEATFDLRWGGPVVGGIPTHTQGAPTTSGTETDNRFAQAERGQDEHRLCYYIRNTSDLPLEIIDTDGRAESLRVYVGCGCDSLLTYERYQQPGGGRNTPPYTSDGNVVATIQPHSCQKMTVLIHDPGPDFSGFRPVANLQGDTTTFENFESYPEKPKQAVSEVDYNLCNPAPLPEDCSFLPIEDIECASCPDGIPSVPLHTFDFFAFDDDSGVLNDEEYVHTSNVNGVATSNPLNPAWIMKSEIYSLTMAAVNAIPGVTVMVVTDRLVTQNGKVRYRITYPANEPVTIVNTHNGDTLLFSVDDEGNCIGTFTDGDGNAIESYTPIEQ